MTNYRNVPFCNFVLRDKTSERRGPHIITRVAVCVESHRTDWIPGSIATSHSVQLLPCIKKKKATFYDGSFFFLSFYIQQYKLKFRIKFIDFEKKSDFEREKKQCTPTSIPSVQVLGRHSGAHQAAFVYSIFSVWDSWLSPGDIALRQSTGCTH